MKLTVFVILAVLALGAGTFVKHNWMISRVLGKPSMTGPEDLGKTFWGEQVLFEVKIYNPSRSAWIIQSLDTGCDCTITTEDWSGTTISPDQTLVVGLRYDSRDYDGDRIISVSGELKDESGTVLNLEFSTSVFVLADFRISPEGPIDFGDIDVMDPIVVSAVVEYRSETSEITKITTDCDWLTTASREVKGGIDVLIEVNKKQLTSGKIYGHVILETNNEHRTHQVLKIEVTGKQDFTPYPRKVFLVGIQEGLVSFLSDGKSVPIAEATSDNENVQVTVNGSSVKLVNLSGEVLPPVKINVQNNTGQRSSVIVYTFK